MRRIFFCLALIIITTVAHAQAEVERTGYKVAISKFKQYYNNNQPDSLFDSFAPVVKTALPLDKTKDLVSQMHAQLGPLKQTTFLKYVQTAAVYKAEYQKENLLINLSINKAELIDGIYFNEYKPDPKTATEAVTKAVVSGPLDPSLVETPIVLSTLAGKQAGTLTMPKNVTGKIPVVLIISGTKPTDRDGNSGQTITANSYKLLAEALGKAGIASLRYDKRGVGQSTTSGKEEDSNFYDFVQDASGFLLMLKDDPRFSKFILLGHGEGALAGIATAYTEKVNAFISVEGPGTPAEQLLMEQMKTTKPPAVADEFKTMTDSLRKGKTVPKVDPALYYLARPSLQKYLISYIFWDPAKLIKKIKAPILIIQGTNDLQVPVTEGEKLKKGKSEAVLKEIDGMNYVLKAAPVDKEKNMATYKEPELPLKPEFVSAVLDFIKTVK